MTQSHLARFAGPISHLWHRLFRNDICISYTRGDAGRNYAHILAVELQKREFDVLMDTFDARQSEHTSKEFLDQMRCCMQLVIVASAGALTSTEVAREVALFPKKRRSIIVLEFDENVRNAGWYKDHLLGLTPVPALEGTSRNTTLQSAGTNEDLLAKPTQETIDLIVNAFKFKRQRLRQTAIAALTGFMTILFVIASAGLLLNLKDLRKEFTKQVDETEEQKRLTKNAIEEGRSAVIGRDQALSAYEQSHAAFLQQTELTTQATQQRISAEQSRKEADALRETAEQQLELAAMRLAATEKLSSDPVLAYRLAEYAYNLAPDAENAVLLRTAASRSRFPYAQEFRNCGLEHVSAPWALLSCGKNRYEYGKKDRNEVWKVVNVESGKVEHEFQNGSSLHYVHAWLVPHEGSWRMLAMYDDFDTNKQVPVRIDTFDASGSLQGTIRDRSYPILCGSDHFLVRQWDLSQVTLLDPHTGSLVPIPREGDDVFVGCKPDGEFVLVRRSTVELFDRNAKSLGASSLTYKTLEGTAPINGLYRDLEYVRVSWSPDGTVLAISEEAVGGDRLYLLNPAAATVTSLTPAGSIDTAYTWEGEHTLIVGGHSIDKTDFAITRIDALDPSRKAVQPAPALIRDIATLPNGAIAIAYPSGLVEITQTADGSMPWRGQQRGVNKLAVAGKFLLTSSSEEDAVRRWPIDPPSSNWIFRSTKDHLYSACAAGDPTFHWLAVVTDRGAAIELRSVTGDDRKTLKVPVKLKDCELAFSRDGRWLTVAGYNSGIVFRVQDWKPYDIPPGPHGGDNVAADRIISVGAGRMSLYQPIRSREPYQIDLTGDVPQFDVQPSKADYKPCEWSYAQNEAITEQFRGWDLILPVFPADRKLHMCGGSGWIENVLFLHGSTDVEFIPSDVGELMRFYDGKMPAIPKEELRSFALK